MKQQEYAGFWIRFGAFLIDFVILFVILFVLLSIIYGDDYWVSNQLVHGFWDAILNYVLPIVVTVWFWLRYLGTPGKMILGLKIVDATSGEKLSLGQAVGRYFAYILSAIPVGLGFLWIAFDDKKQGWHDKLAGSVVVRGGVSESNSPAES